MKMKLLFSALLASVLLAGAAQAESLAEAMALAYASNPVLRAERAGLRATDEQLAQARARRLPTPILALAPGIPGLSRAARFLPTAVALSRATVRFLSTKHFMAAAVFRVE